MSELDLSKVALVFMVVAIGIGIQYGPLAGFLTIVALGVSLSAVANEKHK